MKQTNSKVICIRYSRKLISLVLWVRTLPSCSPQYVVYWQDILAWTPLVFLNLNSFLPVLVLCIFFKEHIRMYHSLITSFVCSGLSALEDWLPISVLKSVFHDFPVWDCSATCHYLSLSLLVETCSVACSEWDGYLRKHGQSFVFIALGGNLAAGPHLIFHTVINILLGSRSECLLVHENLNHWRLLVLSGSRTKVYFHDLEEQ